MIQDNLPEGRQLYLMRHARTESYPTRGHSDRDRMLLESGVRDVIKVASLIHKQGHRIDFIASSTARRAIQTARTVASILGVDEQRIALFDQLYMFEPATYEQVICNLPNEAISALIVGHNFGITDFVNQKVENCRIDIMPTAGLVACKLPIENWHQNNDNVKGDFLFFIHPSTLN